MSKLKSELKTYLPGTPFPGTIRRTAGESVAAWPVAKPAPAGAPNVLVVLLDDVGFAQIGCFGSDIRTPRFDGLAAAGLRYRDFHTTAICSPTRACLLTGRNHHSPPGTSSPPRRSASTRASRRSTPHSSSRPTTISAACSTFLRSSASSTTPWS